MKILHKIGFTALAAAAVFALASCNKDDEYDVTIVEDETEGATYDYFCTVSSATYSSTSYTYSSSTESWTRGSSTTYTVADYGKIEWETSPTANYTVYTLTAYYKSSSTSSSYSSKKFYFAKVGSKYYYYSNGYNVIPDMDTEVTFTSGSPSSSSFTISYTEPSAAKQNGSDLYDGASEDVKTFTATFTRK